VEGDALECHPQDLTVDEAIHSYQAFQPTSMLIESEIRIVLFSAIVNSRNQNRKVRLK
jgi:hypothetical protein